MPHDIHTMPRRQKIEFAAFASIVLGLIGFLVFWATR
jgi:hypothetical protein